MLVSAIHSLRHNIALWLNMRYQHERMELPLCLTAFALLSPPPTSSTVDDWLGFWPWLALFLNKTWFCRIMWWNYVLLGHLNLYLIIKSDYKAAGLWIMQNVVNVGYVRYKYGHLLAWSQTLSTTSLSYIPTHNIKRSCGLPVGALDTNVNLRTKKLGQTEKTIKTNKQQTVSARATFMSEKQVGYQIGRASCRERV